MGKPSYCFIITPDEEMYISLTSRQNCFKQFNTYLLENHLKFQGELKNKTNIIRKSLARKSNPSW